MSMLHVQDLFTQWNKAKAFIESGIVQEELVVIGSEHITWLLDWSDRNTAVLFGDGAGASSHRGKQSNDESEGEIYSFVNGSKF